MLVRAAVCLVAAATSCAFVANAQSIPFINGITPSAVAPGVTADQTLTIAGSSFTAQSVVKFNGTVLSAPVVSNNGETLQVTVPASNFSSPGTATIQVINYAAAGNAGARSILSAVTTPHRTSNPAYLAITNANPSLSYGLSNIGSPISTANVATFATGDFNNDGVMDVAAGNSDGTVQIFLGDGNGGYSATATLGTSGTSPVGALAVGDFNNDGYLDVVVGLVNASGTSSFQVYLGNGDGTATPSSAGPFTTAVGVNPGGPGPTPVVVNGLAVGDINGDGNLDVYAISASSQTSYIILGDGSGGLTGNQAGGGPDFPVTPGATGLVAADFNNDGMTDFAYVDSSLNELVVLQAAQLSPGVFILNASIDSGIGSTPTGLVVGDFNGDGITDLVIASHGDGTYLFLQGTGTGGFTRPVVANAKKTAAAAKLRAASTASSGATPPFPSTGGTTTSIATGDFNGDGIADIALYDGTTLNIYLGDGSGNFNYAAELAANDTTGNAGLAAGNVNNDGYPGFIVGLNSSFAAITTPTPASVFPVPSSLSLGSVNLGSSATQNLPLTNNGATAVTVQTLAVSGANAADFSVPATNPCASVAAAGSCQIPVTFTPTTVGDEAATLTITDTFGTQMVSLSGTGVGAPKASAPATVNIGSSNVGTVVTAVVVLSNTGTGPLNVTSVTTAAPFSVILDGCSGIPVPANGGSCSVTVGFTPASVGPASGMLTFNDNSSTGPSQATSLTGTGTAPIATVSPVALAFGSQTVGSPSAPQTVTVKNTGTSNLTFNSITTTAPFAASNNGCTSLAPGASCTISVVFTPTATGAAPPTNLTIADNGIPSAIQTVALTGSGVNATGAKATVTPASLTFGNQLAGASSAPQSVTLKNTGASALTINSITATAPFQISAKSCGASLAVNASCTVAVVFHPTAAGAASGTLTFTDNSVLGSTQTVSLSGTGVAPTASVSPASLAFGAVALNATSPAQKVTIANTGGATLNISGITVSGNFAISANTCRTTLAAGANCSVSVTFTPHSTGALSGTLTVTDNSSTGTTQKVSLSGSGANIRVSVSPNSLSFFTRANVKTAAQTVTVTNTGTVALSGLSVALAGNGAADFAIASNTCGATLAVGANCKVGITYLSKTNGQFSAELNVNSNAPTASVSLFGYTF